MLFITLFSSILLIILFHEDEQWFDQIDIQCTDTVIDYISTLHKLFIRLKGMLSYYYDHIPTTI